ncbi:MAG: RidA family protein [Alphaproteobacteria bacterium]|nr:RidA family protein [Alphaproteobacteria bacterium]
MVTVTPVHPKEPLPEYNMPFLPAVTTEGGKIVWVAGVGPIPIYHKHPHVPAEEAEWMSGGFRAQFDKTMANIQEVLAAAGGNLRSVVKMTVYLTDMSLQNELNQGIFDYFGRENPPPRTLVGCALSHESMLIEIDVTAVV